MGFDNDVAKIKNLKIQGATSVALFGVASFCDYAKKSKIKDFDSFLKDLEKKKKFMEGARATEPMLFNALKEVVSNLKSVNNITDAKKILGKFSTDYKSKVLEDKKSIVTYGSALIKDGMKIFTHCHSSTVTNILINAKKAGRKFEVFNTETRPLFQGRITAKELKNAGIKVTHFVDSNSVDYINDCDLILLGCDAFTNSHFYNKVGTKMICLIAKSFGIPVYVCTLSSKFYYNSLNGFEPNIEQRDKSEVWDNSPKGLIIENPAFDAVNREYVSKLVTELGVKGFDSTIKRIISYS